MTLLIFHGLFITALLAIHIEAIMYGRFISIKEAPYFISMLDPTTEENVHACGGAIISEHWILTAAHCIDNHTRIMCGESIMDKENSSSIYHIEKIIVHANYPSDPNVYDVALIKLRDPIEFNEYRQPIKIRKNPPRENETVAVVGFGDQGDAKGSPPVLKQTEVPVVNGTLCYFKPGSLGRGNIAFCAGNNGVTDACAGDSGGPAVIDGELAGIVSAGPDCQNYEIHTHQSAVYTRVDAVYEWILKTTKILY